MHKQFIATRDIKFPDSKQYMKFGDTLMFDAQHKSLSIYRNGTLIGTVSFSYSGLQEFMNLGWISDVSKVPAPIAAKPPTVTPEAVVAAVQHTMQLEEDVTPSFLNMEERLLTPSDTRKKPKRDKVSDEA